MKLLTFVLPPLALLLPLTAQVAQENAENPEGNSPAAVAPLNPVPLPTDLDFESAQDIQPAMPESVTIDFASGFDYVKETETLTSRGRLHVTANTGMTLDASGGHYLGTTRKLFLKGPIKLKTEKGDEIFADRAVLDDTAQTITLLGDVSIYQGNTLQRGQKLVYNIATRSFDAGELRTGVFPLLLEANSFHTEEIDGEQVYVGEDAGVTTHDDENPDYWLRASTTKVYPDDRVTFRNLRLYVKDVPILWLPYFSQPLDADLGYYFVPGARSQWGSYLLNSYGVMLGSGPDKWLLSRWNLDFRWRRGIGAGVNLKDRRLKENKNLTGLSLYYTKDRDPTITRTGIPRPEISEHRWRVALQHRIPLPWEAEEDRWNLDFNLNFLSDNYYLEDFERELYRYDSAPDNTINLFRQGDHSLFSLSTRLRPNDFYRSEIRLPEISFDQSKRSLFGSPILHEGTTSFSVNREFIGSYDRRTVDAALALPPGVPLSTRMLRQLPFYERQLVRKMRRLAPGSPAYANMATQLYKPGYTRFHTFHEFSAPTKVGNFLNLTPQVGLGFTNYSAVKGAIGSVNRPMLHLGMEASIKFARSYDDISNRTLGLDGLIHVVRPYLSFSQLTTNDLDGNFPLIDREGFTSRPRTLSPTRLTAIDDFRDWAITRFGVRNDLITRRDSQSWNWLSLDTYVDSYFQDPERLGRKFSNLYNDLEWQPLPWLSAAVETQFPITSGNRGFTEVAASLRFMPTENFEFYIANRHLKDHPYLENSNRLNLRAYYRINEHWGISAASIWELQDGTQELQQYSVHRDFSHWVASLGISSRDNRLKKEFGVFLAFTLKDLPGSSLPIRLNAQ